MERMKSSLSLSMRITKEWMTFSPSSKNRSRIIFEKSLGVLQRRIVIQYWEKIVKSHQQSMIFWYMAGTYSTISFQNLTSISLRPDRSFQNTCSQFLNFMTPMNTQKTLYQKLSQIMPNYSNSASFQQLSIYSKEPAIKFMPCVYSFPLKFTQAIRTFLSYFVNLVMLTLLGTSLSMIDISLAGVNSSFKSYEYLQEVSFFISAVLDSSYHTFILTEKCMPLRIEKQMFFCGCNDRFCFQIIQFHQSKVIYLPSEYLLTKTIPVTYMLWHYYCGYSYYSSYKFQKTSALTYSPFYLSSFSQLTLKAGYQLFQAMISSMISSKESAEVFLGDGYQFNLESSA